MTEPSPARIDFKTLARACRPGTGRLGSGATSIGHAHFKWPAIPPRADHPGIRRGYQTPPGLFRLCLPVLLSALIAGCAATSSNRPGRQPEPADRIAALQQELSGLSPAVEAAEARVVAQAAIAYSRELAASYQVVPPAVFHNLLIRVGIRNRGLCFHWTEDLMRHLQGLELRSYRLYWAVAFKGDDLREHNSVVIAARDQAFADGLVLDPWRHSGKLHWVAVAQDSYPWQELPRDQW